MEQNLNHYRIFYEAAKTGNISRAAENLYISQPAVSKSITGLEHSLGQTLFIRSKKGVKLTEEGKTLYQHLETAFASIDMAENTLKRIKNLGMGQLRIGVSTSLCKYVLLSYLQDFIRENPHVKVSIECNPTFETIQLLKADKIDIGLICETKLDRDFHFAPLRKIHDTFVTTRLYLDNLILREYDADQGSSRSDSETGAGASPLPPMTGLLLFAEEDKKKSSDIPFTEKEILEKSNLMLLDKGNISRQYIDAYIEKHRIQPGQILEINNMDLLIDFAAIGMGVACVVREFVDSYIESGQVIEIPMDYEIPERTVGFVYNEHAIGTTAKRFLDITH